MAKRNKKTAARQAVEEPSPIRLSVEDQTQFADPLLNPPEPSRVLKRAKEAHRRLVLER